MAQRDERGGLLGRHDAGEPRGLQRIALLDARRCGSARSASRDMRIDPRAIASRAVTGLSPTSTILTRPRASTCESAARLDAYSAHSPSSPCARKNDRLSSDTVRSTLFSFTSRRHLQRAGREIQDRLDAGGDDQVDHVLRRRRRHGDHGDADAVAPRDLLQVVDVVDRHAAARLLADLLAAACRTAPTISNPSWRKPG